MELNWIDFKQPRSQSELFGVTIDFIKQNFKKLLLSLVLLAGPVLILLNIVNTFLLRSFIERQENFILTFILSYFGMMLYQFAVMLVTYSYIMLYIERGPGMVDVPDVFLFARKNALLFLRVQLASFFIIIGGMLFCMIPGIYLSIPISLLFIVSLREKLPLYPALSRCFELVKGNWWSVFFFYILLGICEGFIMLVFYIPSFVINFAEIFHQAKTSPRVPGVSTATILTGLLVTIGYMVYALAYVGMSFQYHSLVEQKNATGLLEKLDSVLDGK